MVLEPLELAAVMQKLDKEPWLRASADSLVTLNEYGYQKLRHWFETQLGEEVNGLYLGPKPKRDGKPFAVVLRGKPVSVRTVGTVWDRKKVKHPLLSKLGK